MIPSGSRRMLTSCLPAFNPMRPMLIMPRITYGIIVFATWIAIGARIAIVTGSMAFASGCG